MESIPESESKNRNREYTGRDDTLVFFSGGRKLNKIHGGKFRNESDGIKIALMSMTGIVESSDKQNVSYIKAHNENLENCLTFINKS